MDNVFIINGLSWTNKITVKEIVVGKDGFAFEDAFVDAPKREEHPLRKELKYMEEEYRKQVPHAYIARKIRSFIETINVTKLDDTVWNQFKATMSVLDAKKYTGKYTWKYFYTTLCEAAHGNVENTEWVRQALNICHDLLDAYRIY